MEFWLGTRWDTAMCKEQKGGNTRVRKSEALHVLVTLPRYIICSSLKMENILEENVKDSPSRKDR